MPGAYYNEIDPYAAQWLRNLIAAGHIAPGEVDERSIVDVHPDDLREFTQCHFFAGIGIWSLAARLAGWPDDRPLWTGSCPCQPFSVAGKQKGFADERHLWPVWRDLIAVRRPSAIFGEQVAAASDWLRIVRSDLEAMGYAVGAAPIQAASAGADHLRDRYWFVADSSLSEEKRQRSYRWKILSEQATGGHRSASILVNASSLGLQGLCSGRDIGPPDVYDPRRAAPRASDSDLLAHTDQPRTSEGREQRGGEQCRPGGDQEACSRRDVADCEGIGSHGRAGYEAQGHGETKQRPSDHDFDWVIGADGKSRRVKPGIRLLVNGHPNRVAKLRAFGNAIDPRPAAQWIGAFLDCERGLT